MENKETICAVVVTYNRKDLLIECLGALEGQNNLNAIYILDNASTDKTPELLRKKGYLTEIPPPNINEPWDKTSQKKSLLIHYTRNPYNIGGAGGFHEGVKRAYQIGYDLLWLMDDDTLAGADSLKILLKKYQQLKSEYLVGFLCSKVLWKDEIHLMNLPIISPIIKGTPFNDQDDEGVLIVKSASFVSLLLSTEAVKAVGLPFKEFFLWGEDTEYTDRMTRNGYLGFYVKDSVVYHQTPSNYHSNIFSAHPQEAWKYRLGIRNDLYLKRREGILSLFAGVFYNFIYINFEIMVKRNDNRVRFIFINTLATLSAILFNPPVVRV